MPETLPQTFGRYRIVEKLGEGGMGAVYLAEDTRMRRKVALKVPNFGDKAPQTDLDRFYREARVAAEIRHPGVCRVFDVDRVDGIHFLTMEYIEGTPLDRLLSKGRPWPIDRAVELTVRIAEAMHALHERSIIHRDLKPANIMVQPNGLPVLIDFGLARSLGAASQQLTVEGTSMGTPTYMAPEQLSGRPEAVGPFSDVYALGGILFVLLTGRQPFSPTSMAGLYAMLLHAERPRASDFADVGALLDELCLDVLAIDPKRRPATMLHLIARLRLCLTKTAILTPVTEPLALSVPGSVPNPQTQPVSALNTSSDDVPEMIGVRQSSNARKLAVLAAVAGVLLATLALASWQAWEPSPTPTSEAHSTPPTNSAPPTNLVSEPGVRLRPISDQTVTAGESQTVLIRIERMGPITSEVKLFHDGAAEGIQLRLSPIAAEATEVEITVAADSKAKPGDYKLRLIASVDGWIQSDREWTVHVLPVSDAAKLEFTNSIGVKFKRIPAGKFLMGSPEKEPNRDGDEGPQHEVEITQDFYLGVYEVTQEEYEAVMKTNPSDFHKGGSKAAQVQGIDTKRFPVESVSWDDATRFIEALNKLPAERAKDRLYRLPTEAEWEYACRGWAPIYQVFSHGNTLTFEKANFDWNYPYDSNQKKPSPGRPVSVDDPRFRANDFGLYHMHGNVYEWCSDWCDKAYYQTCVSKNIRKDPQGPEKASATTPLRRVMRGGSWFHNGECCRSAYRGWVTPDTRNNSNGFRVLCVRTR